MKRVNEGRQLDLGQTVAMRMWPTPQHHDGTGPRGKNNTFSDHHHKPHDLCTAIMWPTPPLSLAVKMYPTPRARLTGGVRPERCEDKFNNLESVLSRMMWPTPHSTCSTGAGTGGRDGGLNLQTAVVTYPTPSCTDFRTGYRTDTEAGIEQREKRAKPLRDNVAPGGQVNPDWVEWLMGWPTGWSAIEGMPIQHFDWSHDPADNGEIPRVATGVKNRVQRLKAIGNGQVPQCFAAAWRILSQQLTAKEDQWAS